MPPKRKRAPPPSPPPEPVVSASPSPAPASEDQDEDAGSDNDENPLPTLFNTTFALYRVSPLYLGPERLTKPRLQALSKRLRDSLVGDVVRGVQVGLTGSSAADATLGRAGVLESVGWRWVSSASCFRVVVAVREENADDGSESEEDDPDRNTDARALSVELRYENNTFAACLLPRLYKHDNDGAEDEESAAAAAASQWTSSTRASANLVADQKQFLHLPLLLLRMPTSLRTVLNDFLARTFDVRIRPLRLGTRPLVSSWAAWHANSGVSGNGDHGPRRGLAKDVVLSLGFHVLDEPTDAKKQQQTDPSEVVDPAKNNTTGAQGDRHHRPREEVRRFIRAGQQAVQDRDEEASGHNRRKGERKAGEQISGPGSEKTTMSPSRRRKLAGGKDDEGWSWRQLPEEEGEATTTSPIIKEPFTEAVSLYLDRHLALNMFHPGVRILRIACEGFVLSEGGRIKMFMPPSEDGSSSAWKLLDGLVERARGRDWGSVQTIPGL
ncbi:kinetochore complex Sim4 subunit Fta1-domain-containing protein [Apiospora phragmitis]|uniref:Kinetochore complex Sim4 subunit Fta1-domain-containing protein n=1 Tax=Apiospora phragmitis TaxID=2905665 RepID=A0ABR1T8F5_9PEZI